MQLRDWQTHWLLWQVYPVLQIPQFNVPPQPSAIEPHWALKMEQVPGVQEDWVYVTVTKATSLLHVGVPFPDLTQVCLTRKLVLLNPLGIQVKSLVTSIKYVFSMVDPSPTRCFKPKLAPPLLLT